MNLGSNVPRVIVKRISGDPRETINPIYLNKLGRSAFGGGPRSHKGEFRCKLTGAGYGGGPPIAAVFIYTPARTAAPLATYCHDTTNQSS